MSDSRLRLIAASGLVIGAVLGMAVVRGVGIVGSLLFAVVAVQMFLAYPLTPPLPFFAYPFLAATLFGWAWVHYRHEAR